MATKNTWKPNDKQKLFLETLKGEKQPISLADASEKANILFATGCINPLITKGLISTMDGEFDCNIVRVSDNKVMGHTKKKVKLYSLTENESESK